MINKDRATADYQRRVNRFIQTEVLCNVSQLVAIVASGSMNVKETTELSPLCEQAAELCAPVLDYKEAAIQAGWSGPFANAAGDVYFTQTTDPQKAAYEDDCTSWADLCETHSIDPYEWEIYEHYAVSAWLAEKLEAEGERINRDFAGLNVWGRTTTGQSISIDGVICDIYDALHQSATGVS